MSREIKIGSSFLLIIYILVLGHDLIPHSHDENKAYHTYEISEVPHHHKTEAHITHADHCDPGLLDLLMCVLSELDHPVNGEGYPDFYFTKAKEFPFQTLKAKELAFLSSFFSIWMPEKQVTGNFAEKLVFYRSPELSCLRFRGPPALIG